MDQNLSVGKKRVSVIIPTYNYGRFINGAIQSALSQTYDVHEVIVVDDGSTDDTEKTVGQFSDGTLYLRQKNLGVSAARNLGVSKSTGELLAFLDADDSWAPDKIEKQVAKFESDPEIGLVHCGMHEFDSDTGEFGEIAIEGEEGWLAEKHVLFEKQVINVSGSAIMVSRDAFDAVGGFDRRLKNGEDWEFCFRVAQKYKIGFIKEALVNYRIHQTNATKNIREMERSTLIAWGKIFNTDDPSLKKLRRRSYGNLHKVLAGSYLERGDHNGFLRNLIKSLWYRPSYLAYYLTRPLHKKNKGLNAKKAS